MRAAILPLVGLSLLALTACGQPRADTSSRPLDSEVAVAAGGPDEEAAVAASLPPAPPATAAPASETDAPMVRPTVAASVRLEDRFYVDSNGNVIPDLVEEAIGYDPGVEEVGARGVPGGGRDRPGGGAAGERAGDPRLLGVDGR